MTDLTTWKMITDAGLVLALLWLCVRMVRGGRPAVDAGRIRSLQRGLKALLSEAESASSDLSKELRDRQRTLEQTLFELQSVESRITRAIDTAEALKRELEQPPSAGSFEAPRTAPPVTHSEPLTTSHETPPQQDTVARQASASRQQRREAAPPRSAAHAASQEFLEPASFDEAGASSKHARAASPPPGDDVPRNIYGEPIVSKSPPAQPAQPTPSMRSTAAGNAYAAAAAGTAQQEGSPFSSLAQQIEREIKTDETPREEKQTPTPPGNEVQRGLEDVYSAAEEMLREGEALEAVSARTQLPVDEVKMLSQIIKQERQSPESEPALNASDSDERLGVLGSGILRQRTVL